MTPVGVIRFPWTYSESGQRPELIPVLSGDLGLACEAIDRNRDLLTQALALGFAYHWPESSETTPEEAA
jgi:hypothetical protein